jgi:hypothetical protein
VGSERRPAADAEAQARATQADRVELSSSARKSNEPAKLRLSMQELRALISDPVESTAPKAKPPEKSETAAKANVAPAARETRRTEDARPAPSPTAARAAVPKTSNTGELPPEVKPSTRPADTKSRS